MELQPKNDIGGPLTSVSLVRDFVTQIARTLSACRLYSASNQLRQDMFGELTRRAQVALEAEETILLEVASDRLLWQGEPVLESGERDQHFTLELYKDGVRQIIFSRGLSEDELHRFLEIIRPRSESRDAAFSPVEALWDAEFAHISHLAVDGFSQLLNDDGESSSGAPSLATQFQSLLGDLVGGRRTINEDGLEDWAFNVTEDLPAVTGASDDFITISESIASPLQAFMSDPAQVGQELTEWLADARKTREQKLLLQLEDLLLYLLENEESDLQDDDFVGLFSRITRHWLARGGFRAAGELLGRLEQVRFEIPERAHISTAVLRDTGGAALHDLVSASEDLDGALWDVTEALRFFDRHFDVADDELVELMTLEHGPNSSRLLGYMLTHRASQRPGFWAPRYRLLSANLATVSLAALAASFNANPEVLAVFHEALGNPDPRVRVSAIRCFPGPQSEVLRSSLLEQLESPDLEVRCAVIDRYGEVLDLSAGAFLVNRMRRTGLADLDPQEAGSLARTLLKLSPERYADFLYTQLAQLGVGGGLLSAQKVKRSEQQVASVLDQLAACRSAASQKRFREIRSGAKGELRKYCDQLWRTVMADWRGEAQPQPVLDPADLTPFPGSANETWDGFVDPLPEEVDV